MQRTNFSAHTYIRLHLVNPMDQRSIRLHDIPSTKFTRVHLAIAYHPRPLPPQPHSGPVAAGVLWRPCGTLRGYWVWHPVGMDRAQVRGNPIRCTHSTIMSMHITSSEDQQSMEYEARGRDAHPIATPLRGSCGRAGTMHIHPKSKSKSWQHKVNDGRP